MIVPMVKAYVVARERDRQALLRRLRDAGVLHIVPVARPEGAAAEDDRGEGIREADAALQVLRAIEPRGPKPQMAPDAAIAEVLAIGREGEEDHARLDALYREADRVSAWGGVRAAQLRGLADAGVTVRALVVPDGELRSVRARLIKPVGPAGRGRTLVAAVDPDEEAMPGSVEVLAPPERDRDAILAEAAAVERGLDARRTRLKELAWLVPEVTRERARRMEAARWDEALGNGLAEDSLFAVQGWVPRDATDALGRLARAGDPVVALRVQEPEPDEEPPTLVRYARWARPVDALFRTLRMVPGYRENDASTVFMVALPLFAGMIIGDAGYGLLFALFPLLFGRRLGLDPELRAMMGLFGLAAIAWGAVTGVWFGLTPADLLAAGAGGTAAAGAGAEAATGAGGGGDGVGSIGVVLGGMLGSLQLVRGSERETWMLLIKICFGLGAAHLILAHVRQMLAYWPDTRALAEAGWCVILASMLAVIWILFFGMDGHLPDPLGPAAGSGIALGLVLVAGFSAPGGGWGRRIGRGLAGSLLPLLGTFSDTLSYIRLMAVGLASYYLGSTFNILAGQVADGGSWFGAVAVLLFGHALNLGLIAIAIFAHGVRLNVLEFSSNAGIRWTGYAYRPFSDHIAKEA